MASNRFNLSAWALGHRTLVLYLMLACLAGGIWSYLRLARNEDPPFTIKTMVVRTLWPGATTTEVMNQVTDRIEKKLEETPWLDHLQSYSRPGESVVFVNLKDSVPAGKVKDVWYQVRKKTEDIAATLPSGIAGPFFNDEFGDTFGIVYAFTADGHSHRVLRDRVEDVRAEILRTPDIAKAQLLGAQDEQILIEFSPARLAALGLDPDKVLQSLRAQNAVAPAGTIETEQEKILVRVTGSFESEAAIRAINLRVDGRFVRLVDVADVRRSFVDPPAPMFRFNGEPAIGLAISMAETGNILEFGRAVRERMARAMKDIPAGIEAHLVADQPETVQHAVRGFMKTLVEAILIVLAISFLSLGLRAGLVVAVSIPLVLAITFVGMDLAGIGLQRISLGALIIALGLLVDDAMITVETMVSKLEERWAVEKAATFAYTSTAFPMLTGTLVTVAGFIPVGFSASSAGEYCFSLFAVVAISLVASWVVAVLFSPLIGVALLPKQSAGHHGGPGRLMTLFRATVVQALRHKWLVIGGTLAIFAASLFGATKLEQQFFPASDRPELLVSLTLPQNASIRATEAEAKRFEALLEGDPRVERFSTYVGWGAIRFYLPMDVLLANDNVAQVVVLAKGLKERDALAAKLAKALDTEFPNVTGRVAPLEMGPPVGWPVKYRVTGPDMDKVREIALGVSGVVAQSPSTRLVNMTWGEPQKVVSVHVDQDQARGLGLSSQQISFLLDAVFTGAKVTSVRDRTYLVDVLARAKDAERLSLETIRSLQIAVGQGRSVPLSQIATVEYKLDAPIVWRRHRQPMIIVQADVAKGVQAATAVEQLSGRMADIRRSLPPGYSVETAGAVEESGKGQASVAAVVPAMAFVMLTLLMLQLQNVARIALVVCVAPLGLIGVVAAMLPTGTPMGFIAILGVISLAGMIIRNGVILIEQIEETVSSGRERWEAIIDATVHRLRPIALTACAAILGMIPIAFEVFWGPMAYAVMGGLLVATALTVLFLPAAYAAWFGVRAPLRPEPAARSGPPAGTAAMAPITG